MKKPPEITLWPCEEIAYVETETGLKYYCPRISNFAAFIRQLYRSQVFDPLPHNKIGPNDVVVDVGSHIGRFSIYAASKTKNRVFAFEPLPQVFEFLQANIRLNQFNNIVAIRKAVDVRKGKRLMYIGRQEDPEMAYFGDKNLGGRKLRFSFMAETITLEKVLAEEGIETIDFLKINAEGAEGELIPYWQETGLLQRVQKFTMHFHPEISILSGQEMYNLLEKAGLEISLRGGFKNKNDWWHGWRKK